MAPMVLLTHTLYFVYFHQDMAIFYDRSLNVFFRKFSKFACKYFSNLNNLFSCAIFSEFFFQVS